MMIQSSPRRAESRRYTRDVFAQQGDEHRADSLAARVPGPNRAQRRARPAEVGTGESPTSNSSSAPRRAARITQRRRAIRAARRHTR